MGVEPPSGNKCAEVNCGICLTVQRMDLLESEGRMAGDLGRSEIVSGEEAMWGLAGGYSTTNIAAQNPCCVHHTTLSPISTFY